jgi:hypothetical protein
MYAITSQLHPDVEVCVRRCAKRTAEVDITSSRTPAGSSVISAEFPATGVSVRSVRTGSRRARKPPMTWSFLGTTSMTPVACGVSRDVPLLPVAGQEFDRPQSCLCIPNNGCTGSFCRNIGSLVCTGISAGDEIVLVRITGGLWSPTNGCAG